MAEIQYSLYRLIKDKPRIFVLPHWVHLSAVVWSQYKYTCSWKTELFIRWTNSHKKHELSNQTEKLSITRDMMLTPPCFAAESYTAVWRTILSKGWIYITAPYSGDLWVVLYSVDDSKCCRKEHKQQIEPHFKAMIYTVNHRLNHKLHFRGKICSKQPDLIFRRR